MNLKLLKQAGTAAVASALLLSCAPQVWAADASAAVTAAAPDAAVSSLPVYESTADVEVNINKEKALELVQTYITIPAGYTLQSANLNAYPDASGKASANWNFSYIRQVDDQYMGDMYVSINAMDGRLLDYYFNNNDPSQKPSYPPKADYKQAKAVAEAWVAKINPQQKDRIRYNVREEQQALTPLNSYQQYSVRFDRVENGVPFAENGVTVTVNGNGDVTGYSFRWDDEVKFEPAGEVIGLDKAASLFRDKARVVPVYQIPYDAKDKSKLFVAYTMDTLALKAVNGELWGSTVDASAEPGAFGKPISDKPLGDKPAGGLKLSKEEALARVTASFKVPAGFKLTNASYSEYPSGYDNTTATSWNFSWTQPESSDKQEKRIGSDTVMANVNSATGEVTGFNYFKYYGPDAGQQVVENVSLDKAKQQAVELVKKQLPYYANQLVLEPSLQQGLAADDLKETHSWNFTFQRVVDGMLAGYETVNVGIDRTSGEVTNFSSGISGLAYPSQKPQLLALDDAKERLFSQYDIELGYVSADSSNRPMVKGVSEAALSSKLAGVVPPVAPAGEGSREAKLVYSLVPKYVHDAFFLDAETGEWRDAANGETMSLEKPVAADIAGHWAQNELQLMLDYRALDVVDGKVSPNAAITKGELIKMLVIAMNGGRSGIQYSADRAASFADVKAGSPYFAYVENAVDRGLLEPGASFNPQAHMTREEMASLIVKALGFKSLAGYTAIFNDRFADAAEVSSVGEVAIVTGLNIMTLTDGRFSGKQEVTRAQAATAFYRFLEKRAELGDQRPPRYM